MQNLKWKTVCCALIAVFVMASGRLYDYRAVQLSARINSTDNEYILVHGDTSSQVQEIEFKRDISRDSGLMVRVIFGNEQGPIHPQVASSNQMNICTMLDNAIDNATSSQAKYRMPESLNLQGRRCPIKPMNGRRALDQYKFPSEFMTNKDMGCGYVTFLMRVEAPGSSLQELEPLVELFVELDLTKPDGC